MHVPRIQNRDEGKVDQIGVSGKAWTSVIEAQNHFKNSSGITGNLSPRRTLSNWAYLVAAIGTVGDHLSTRIALTHPLIVEANPFTLLLRRFGLWLPFDILLLAVCLGVPAIVVRSFRFEGRWAILAMPFLVGAARLVATSYNVLLLMSLL
jgi:hypothetical protein